MEYLSAFKAQIVSCPALTDNTIVFIYKNNTTNVHTIIPKHLCKFAKSVGNKTLTNLVDNIECLDSFGMAE
ncbi:uncharacterized protein CHSO_2727 [Chryseobacterium sp. StRB126]|nr:uncharacterized protein CHSO_2727 [Chryseobacterium sp. StRB126]